MGAAISSTPEYVTREKSNLMSGIRISGPVRPTSSLHAFIGDFLPHATMRVIPLEKIVENRLAVERNTWSKVRHGIYERLCEIAFQVIHNVFDFDLSHYATFYQRLRRGLFRDGLVMSSKTRSAICFVIRSLCCFIPESNWAFHTRYSAFVSAGLSRRKNSL